MSWPYVLEVPEVGRVRRLEFKTLTALANELAHLHLEGVRHAHAPDLTEDENKLVTSLAAQRLRMVRLLD